MDGCEKVSGEFIVSGGDPSEIFVSAFVGALVEAVESCPVGLVRDDGTGAAVEDVGAKVVAIVALVGDEGAHRRSERQKGWSSGDIGVLAGSEMECAGPAIRIAQCMDFRGTSAARAADRLFMLPPFPPLAERCALIEVESIDKITLSFSQLANAAKIVCQRAHLAQRLKRL